MSLLDDMGIEVVEQGRHKVVLQMENYLGLSSLNTSKKV